MRRLKIAQIAPLWFSIPPKKYGGTERIIFYLCEELTKLGHEVTLFASGDSKTKAKLIAPKKASLFFSRLAIKKLPGESMFGMPSTLQEQ